MYNTTSFGCMLQLISSAGQVIEDISTDGARLGWVFRHLVSAERKFLYHKTLQGWAVYPRAVLEQSKNGQIAISIHMKQQSHYHCGLCIIVVVVVVILLIVVIVIVIFNSSSSSSTWSGIICIFIVYGPK